MSGESTAEDISVSSISSFENDNDNETKDKISKKEYLKQLLKRKLKKALEKRKNKAITDKQIVILENNNVNESKKIDTDNIEKGFLNNTNTVILETKDNKHEKNISDLVSVVAGTKDINSGYISDTNQVVIRCTNTPTKEANKYNDLNQLVQKREFGALVSMKTVIRQSPRITEKQHRGTVNANVGNDVAIKPLGSILDDCVEDKMVYNSSNSSGDGDDYSYRINSNDTDESNSDDDMFIDKKRNKKRINKQKRSPKRGKKSSSNHSKKDKVKLNENLHSSNNKVSTKRISKSFYTSEKEIEVKDEDWFVVLPDGYIEIPRDFVPTETVSEDHIKYMVTKLGKSLDKSNLEICEHKINIMQKLLKSVGRLQIERIIQKKCSDLNLVYGEDKRKVKNLQDLKKLFASDSSLENCVMIWNIMIGQFEDGISLLQNIESNILEQKKWRYGTTESDLNCRSGFIEKILLQQRRQKIRLLNNAALRTHGRTIMLSRPANIITEENRFVKRKKGYCDTSYMIGGLLDSTEDTSTNHPKKKQKNNSDNQNSLLDHSPYNSSSVARKSNEETNSNKDSSTKQQVTSFYEFYKKSEIGCEINRTTTPKKCNVTQLNSEDNNPNCTTTNDDIRKSYKVDSNEITENFGDDEEDNSQCHNENTDVSSVIDLKQRSPEQINKQLKDKNLFYKKQIEEMKKKLSEQMKYNKQFELLQENEQLKLTTQQLEISAKKSSDKMKQTDNMLHKRNKQRKLDKEESNEKQITKKKTLKQIAVTVNTHEDDSTIVPITSTVEWEIEADTSIPFSEFISPTTDDNSTILELINIRKKKDEKCELLILWSCGSYEWAMIENVWKDNKEVVKSYNKDHAKDYIASFMESKKRGRKPKIINSQNE